MPVTQRGSSWQAAASYKGKRYRRDFPTKQEAEVWLHQTMALLVAGKAVDGHSSSAVPTLAEHLKTVSAARWQGRKAEETLLKNAEQVVDILGPSRLVSSLVKADSDLIKQEFRRRHRSDATINRKLAALSVLVKEAVERGHLAKGFTVGLLRERQGRIRFVTLDEERAMLDWCDRTGNQNLRDYIIVSLDTGFRQGEVLKIEARDCGKVNLWTYDTKSGKSREVPLTKRTQIILEKRAYCLRPEKKVFDFDPQWIRERWRKMQTAMDLIDDEEFVPHCLRHTFVTRLLERGVDIKTVQELAGHERIETTQRYAHTSPERKVMAIQRLMTHDTGVAQGVTQA